MKFSQSTSTVRYPTMGVGDDFVINGLPAIFVKMQWVNYIFRIINQWLDPVEVTGDRGLFQSLFDGPAMLTQKLSPASQALKNGGYFVLLNKRIHKFRKSPTRQALY